MEYKQVKRIFFNWLKSQDAYEAYKLARHNTNHLVNGHRNRHPYYRRHLSPLNFINHAFTWGLTHEGHSFWDRLNSEWRKYLRKLEIDSKY